MSKSLILLIFIITNAYAYERNDFKFTNVQYSRYVKPQIKNIISNYKKILFNLIEPIKGQEKNFDLFNKIIKEKGAFNKSCKKAFKSDFCLNSLNDLKVKLQEIELKPEEPVKEQIDLLVKRIEAISFKNNILKNFKPDLYDIENQTINVYLMYNISLVDKAPKFIRREFEGLWSNYIHPLQNQLVDSDAQEFFINKTDILNRAWNLFHVKLEKRGYKISKTDSTLITIMHSRWNQILKVILKR